MLKKKAPTIMKQALKFGFRTEGIWLGWSALMACTFAAVAWFEQLSTPYVALLALTVLAHVFVGLFRIATAARFLAARRSEGDLRENDELGLAWERRSWPTPMYDDARTGGSPPSGPTQPPGWSFNTNGMPMQGHNSLQDLTGHPFGSSGASSSGPDSPF